MKLDTSSGRVVRWVSLLLAVLVPLSMMSADLKTAMLYGKGEVSVNGKGAGASSALYAGDTVRTGAKSSATITGAGTVVTLDENSGMAFGANSFDVSQGRVVVNTTKGVTTHFAKLTVTPGASQAKFAVVRANGTFEIAALTGPLTISDGTHTALLAAGNMITKADGQEPAPPEPKSKRKKGAFAIPGWEVALIAGAGAGATYGIYRAITGDHGPKQSPTSANDWSQ